MVEFIAVRHGPTAWNAQKKIQGHTDIPLSVEGEAVVSQWALPIYAQEWRCFSSPLHRAQQTARALGLSPQVASALIEMNWGRWEGQKITALRETLGPLMTENEAQGLDFRADGGESKRDVLTRIQTWVREQDGQPFVMVAHKGILHVLYAWATGWDMSAKPSEKMKEAHCHHFRVTAAGALDVVQLNIPLKGCEE